MKFVRTGQLSIVVWISCETEILLQGEINAIMRIEFSVMVYLGKMNESDVESVIGSRAVQVCEANRLTVLDPCTKLHPYK